MLELLAEPVHAAAALLGECPHWDPAWAAWWWVDILGRVLHRFDGVRDIAWAMPDMLSVVVPRAGGHPAGGVVLALRDRIVGFADGVLGDDLARVDHPGQRFNDGKCDPRGRLWVGSLSLDGAEGRSALYRLDQRGLIRQLGGVSISNGLGWSADGRTMYYVDTPTGRIDAFAYDLDDGVASARRPLAVIPESLGWPDGLALDDDGFLWVALWDGGALVRIDPRDGTICGRITVPGARRPTSCAFAGRRLLITTSADGVRGPQQPHAGDLFLMDLPVGGPGRPAFAG